MLLRKDVLFLALKIQGRSAEIVEESDRPEAKLYRKAWQEVAQLANVPLQRLVELGILPPSTTSSASVSSGGDYGLADGDEPFLFDLPWSHGDVSSRTSKVDGEEDEAPFITEN